MSEFESNRTSHEREETSIGKAGKILSKVLNMMKNEHPDAVSFNSLPDRLFERIISYLGDDGRLHSIPPPMSFGPGETTQNVFEYLDEKLRSFVCEVFQKADALADDDEKRSLATIRKDIEDRLFPSDENYFDSVDNLKLQRLREKINELDLSVPREQDFPPTKYFETGKLPEQAKFGESNDKNVFQFLDDLYQMVQKKNSQSVKQNAADKENPVRKDVEDQTFSDAPTDPKPDDLPVSSEKPVLEQQNPLASKIRDIPRSLVHEPELPNQECITPFFIQIMLLLLGKIEKSDVVEGHASFLEYPEIRQIDKLDGIHHLQNSRVIVSVDSVKDGREYQPYLIFNGTYHSDRVISFSSSIFVELFRKIGFPTKDLTMKIIQNLLEGKRKKLKFVSLNQEEIVVRSMKCYVPSNELVYAGLPFGFGEPFSHIKSKWIIEVQKLYYVEMPKTSKVGKQTGYRWTEGDLFRKFKPQTGKSLTRTDVVVATLASPLPEQLWKLIKVPMGMKSEVQKLVYSGEFEQFRNEELCLMIVACPKLLYKLLCSQRIPGDNILMILEVFTNLYVKGTEEMNKITGALVVEMYKDLVVQNVDLKFFQKRTGDYFNRMLEKILPLCQYLVKVFFQPNPTRQMLIRGFFSTLVSKPRQSDLTEVVVESGREKLTSFRDGDDVQLIDAISSWKGKEKFDIRDHTKGAVAGLVFKKPFDQVPKFSECFVPCNIPLGGSFHGGSVSFPHIISGAIGMASFSCSRALTNLISVFMFKDNRKLFEKAFRDTNAKNFFSRLGKLLDQMEREKFEEEEKKRKEEETEEETEEEEVEEEGEEEGEEEEEVEEEGEEEGDDDEELVRNIEEEERENERIAIAERTRKDYVMKSYKSMIALWKRFKNIKKEANELEKDELKRMTKEDDEDEEGTTDENGESKGDEKNVVEL